MQTPLLHQINKNNFWLSPDRCVYWEENKTLILSDLHFGKTGHFRKAGIAVPQDVFKNDLLRLMAQVQFFQPDQIVVVGDLFHSYANKELELFKKWREDILHVEVHLVKGNHDILAMKWYNDAAIHIHNEHLKIGDFGFVHDCEQPSVPDVYYFCGHIHPGVCIRGVGKQILKFPCFYFKEDYAVLPAFSHFTGIALVEPKKKESVYAIVDNKVLRLHGAEAAKNCI